MQECKIAIIGAGPAGLSAGLTLASHGFHPIIFEEHSVVGYPLQCGEGVSDKIFQMFNIPLNNEIIVRKVNTTALHLPNNSIVYGDINAFMISRPAFDQFLANKTTDLGGTIYTNTKVIRALYKKNGVELTIRNKTANKKETINCNYLILAEGARARIAQSLGFVPPSPLISAYEYKIKGSWTENLDFYFDAEKFPDGYAWIFPRGDETNIGIVSSALNLPQRLLSFMKEQGITGSITQKIAGMIPMKGTVPKLFDSFSLVVGDAAGMVNPLFYGGIRIGMTSGKVAADTLADLIKEEKSTFSNSLDLYQKRLSRYPFMSNINVRSHNFFYGRSNSFLNSLGKFLHNQYINRIELKTVIKPLLKLLIRPKLWSKPYGLYLLYRGFKIARDWGF